MELEPAHFNDLLARVGQKVKWRRAHDCPCVDKANGGVPAADCRVCRNGKVWMDAEAGVIGLTSQKVNKQWAQFGLWEKGDVVCTLPSDTPVYRMGEFDRVLFENSTAPFSIVRTMETPLKLEFNPHCIDRVFWLNEAKDAVVEGRIPEILEDGTLKWRTGAPADGTQITISGRKHPEYFCFMDFPQDRAHHGGKALPRKVVLRLFDLYGRAA